MPKAMHADSPAEMPPMKPTIRLTSKDLPSLKSKTIDEVFNVYARVKVTSLGRDRWVEGKPLEAVLEIVSVKENTKQTISQDENNAAHIRAGLNRK